MPSGSAVIATIVLGAAAIGIAYAFVGVALYIRMGVELESYRDYEGHKRTKVVDDMPYPTARHLGHGIMRLFTGVAAVAAIVGGLYAIGILVREGLAALI